MRKDEYIESVINQISFKHKRRIIASELSAHIEDRQKYFIDCGYDENAAEQMAVEKMGSIESVASSMNKLHCGKGGYIAAASALLVYIACLIISILDIPNLYMVDFAIISLDSSEVTALPCVVSLIAFANIAVCYNIAEYLKSVWLFIMEGIAAIIGTMANIYLLMPFGYTIIGFFTDYPSTFFADHYTYFFEGEITWALDDAISSVMLSSILEIIMSALVVISAFGGIVLAVMCIISAITNRYEENSDRIVKERLGKYGKFIIILTIASAVALTAEITTDFARQWSFNKQFNNIEALDTSQAIDAFNEIELPMTYEQAKDFVKSYGDYYLDSDETLKELCMLDFNINSHYTIVFFDNDSNGTFEQKRLMANFNVDIDRGKIEAAKGMSLEEAIDYLGFGAISSYYCTEENGKLHQELQLDFTLEDNPAFYSFSYTDGEFVDMQAYTDMEGE